MVRVSMGSPSNDHPANPQLVLELREQLSSSLLGHDEKVGTARRPNFDQERRRIADTAWCPLIAIRHTVDLRDLPGYRHCHCSPVRCWQGAGYRREDPWRVTFLRGG